GLAPGYALKLNSYDLGVDIELADAIQRLRFSHPEVHALVVTSLRERLFSAGANIYMLASSSHPSKVNFCKFTNETRLHLEEMSAESGIRTLAALNGTASGGGYELESLSPRLTPTGVDYRWVRLAIDREKRVASLTVRAPDHGEPETPAAFLEAGSRAWAIAAWRELDDALLHLRFNELEIGVVLLRTAGDSAAVLAVDRAIDRHHGHWLVREIALLQKRVLKRLDLTARSIFALVEPGSA